MRPEELPGGQGLLSLAPVPRLLERLRAGSPTESGFAKESAAGPIRISRAPGRLDVMGGIADYTGSMVCEATLDRAAAVALQPRMDRSIQVLSFNLQDDQKSHTFGMSLDELAGHSITSLREHFNAPGRRWAGYMIGCLAVLADRGLVDLKESKIRGMNLALLSDVPLGAGVSSSAAIEVATMMNLIDHLGIRVRLPLGVNRNDAMLVAAMCQQVENHVVGAPCGIMDQVSSCAGEAGSLLRMICQPHELQQPLYLPAGVRVIGINSHVKHSVGGGMYGITRCAAFMGHRMILEKMRELGAASGRELISDPMRGYLANLDPEDYKRFFRPNLPQQMNGAQFISRYQATVDTATRVESGQSYHVLSATDHHVLEARRVRNFVEHVEEAGRLAADSRERKLALDKAGHLMYGSHLSYTRDALMGADECDLLVELVRERESAGLYGAKITGGGSGGTVAVLANEGSKVDQSIAEIMAEYEKRTGIKPEAFLGTSPGAWAVGTAVESFHS